MTSDPSDPAVLYVDDENKALKYFSRAMGADFNVITASDADAARHILRERGDEIGVLLTDQRMPGGDGVSLLSECKERHPQILRLLTTAYTDIDDAIAAVNRGEVWRYITKPWDLAGLRDELVAAFEVHRQRRWERAMLDERYRTLGSVAGHMAHEMRTPLLSIRSAANALERYLPTLSDAHRQAVDAGLPVSPIRGQRRAALGEAIGSIQRTVERANAVIDLLLVNSGSYRLESAAITTCSLRQTVETALADYPFAPGDRAAVELLPSQDFRYRGAMELTVFVIHNLLRNALRAIHEANRGGVRLWLVPGRGSNALHVEDDGVGIAPEARPYIFDDFRRFANDDAGVGIGLAFCRRVMEGLGGSIECASEPDGFTRISLLFPCVTAEQSIKENNPT